MAIETHQEYGVDTYDLDVALKAYSIQRLDAHRFDKLPIMRKLPFGVGFLRCYWHIHK